MFLVVAVVVCARAGAYTGTRVDEIAGWLPERPAACGARIGDRAAWDRLAALPSAASRIKAAEKALAEPIPDVPDELCTQAAIVDHRKRRAYDARVANRVPVVAALVPPMAARDGRLPVQLLAARGEVRLARAPVALGKDEVLHVLRQHVAQPVVH